MSSQFGSNWPGFMEKFGNIAGPLLAYEVLTAFFLEATFLGIMLFGINKVSNKVHTISATLVAIGTTLSAFWIMALGSWMQTPDGFKMIDGVAYPENWIKIVFNPSMTLRFVHMILASGLTVAFLIAGISAYCIIKNGQSESTTTALKSSIICAAILSIAQLFSGDALGLNSLKHQPAKIASVEAMWETGYGMPLRIFAIPDNKLKKNKFEIGIPKIGGLILTHKMNGLIKGINDFPEHPP
uniref:Cytochrome ubiquinol oxidase subunit I n=1 Tax=Biomphalaria glabrata TaxID=6526 RepID=A0A2C9KXB7_BIOGL